MTPSIKTLRILVTVHVTCSMFAGIMPVLTKSLLPTELRAYDEDRVAAELTLGDLVLLNAISVFVLLWLVSAIGLFFVWRPARSLFLWSGILGGILVPFSGPHIDAGWGTVFADLTAVTGGAILALLYLSPLAAHFTKAGGAAGDESIRIGG